MSLAASHAGELNRWPALMSNSSAGIREAGIQDIMHQLRMWQRPERGLGPSFERGTREAVEARGQISDIDTAPANG